MYQSELSFSRRKQSCHRWINFHWGALGTSPLLGSNQAVAVSPALLREEHWLLLIFPRLCGTKLYVTGPAVSKGLLFPYLFNALIFNLQHPKPAFSRMLSLLSPHWSLSYLCFEQTLSAVLLVCTPPHPPSILYPVSSHKSSVTEWLVSLWHLETINDKSTSRGRLGGFFFSWILQMTCAVILISLESVSNFSWLHIYLPDCCQNLMKAVLQFVVQ